MSAIESNIPIRINDITFSETSNLFVDMQIDNNNARIIPQNIYVKCFFLKLLNKTFFTNKNVLNRAKIQKIYFDVFGKARQNIFNLDDNKSTPVDTPKKTGQRNKKDFLKFIKILETLSKSSLKTPRIIAVVPPLTPGMSVPKPMIIPLK